MRSHGVLRTPLEVFLIRLMGRERCASLLDPAGGVHFLEEGEGALDHRAILERIVTFAEASVGQEGLSQLGTGLDALQHLQTAEESGVSLGPIAHGLMNLSEDAVRGTFLEPKPPLFRY